MIEPWLTDYLPAGGRIAIDVGANVGSFTVWMAERFERVYAFEPHPKAFEQLLAACHGNDRVVVCEAAVGAISGDLTLNTFAESVHTSAFDDTGLDTLSRGPAAGVISVPVVALDDAFATVRAEGFEVVQAPERLIDFVKVDTEGYECEVLRGAEETLRASKPALLVEVHAEANGEWCHGFLTGLGYEPVRIPHPHGGVPGGHHWIACDRF